MTQGEFNVVCECLEKLIVELVRIKDEQIDKQNIYVATMCRDYACTLKKMYDNFCLSREITEPEVENPEKVVEV